MIAISIRQPWAELIARGTKTIEYRTWMTRRRGDLLIVASKAPDVEGMAEHRIVTSSLVYGAAVCVVDLWHIEGEYDDWEWHVRHPRRVAPVPIRGFAALYRVANERVVLAPRPRSKR